MNTGYGGATKMVMSTRSEQGQVDRVSKTLHTGSACERKQLRTAGLTNGR